MGTEGHLTTSLHGMLSHINMIYKRNGAEKSLKTTLNFRNCNR